jgi:hypothetical protein
LYSWRLSGPLFQTHYSSENLVAPGIEPRPLNLYSGATTTRPQSIVEGEKYMEEKEGKKG